MELYNVMDEFVFFLNILIDIDCITGNNGLIK